MDFSLAGCSFHPCWPKLFRRDERDRRALSFLDLVGGQKAATVRQLSKAKKMVNESEEVRF